MTEYWPFPMKTEPFTVVQRVFEIDKKAKWVLRHVPGEQVRSVWPEVRGYLEETLKACPDSDTWTPEDVYHEIKSGRAFLHVVGEPSFGCLVLQMMKDQYTAQPYVHVWIAYSKILGAMQNLMPELERMARGVGANKIVCHSPFEAFSAAGFTKKMMIFERTI